ncbi:MAG: type II toxin-antitoxin system RelE/ParE family toxin [Acidobacteria bacterium]|nr:type II toxin-antitoxin system RelE/ParE family toxin [Acidobacteriota bacterium]
MNFGVRTTPEADAQVRAIDGWWRQHRTAAPALFFDELEAAFSLISHAPDLGHSYRRSPIAGTRRVLLPRTRYHVYYVPLDGVVVVLAVWYAKRGNGPPLRLL